MPIIMDRLEVKQPTGCHVYYRVPSKNAKKPKPILRCIYVDTLNIDVAHNAVMEDLHMTQEHYLKPLLVLLTGGKV
jgi:hypothetical protein|tara:strand:- start:133 stop:360 length:228 start_codon:yes stop_codon:yes gene_type:complete